MEDLLLDGHFATASYSQIVELYKRMRTVTKFNRQDLLKQHHGTRAASFMLPSFTASKDKDVRASPAGGRQTATTEHRRIDLASSPLFCRARWTVCSCWCG